MAQALAEAIAASERTTTIVASDPDKERLARFGASLPQFVAASDNAATAAESDLVFLSVKPQFAHDVFPDLSDTNKLIVSIAAGITIATLQANLPHARIVRVMPNTPCLVGEMAAGYSPGATVTEEDVELVDRLLSTAGVAIQLTEDQLDAVTGLSGSGPAFVARLIEAFIDAGVAAGLEAGAARALALATFSGTANLLSKRCLAPEELITMVSSKGGTTVAGRAVLESSDYRDVISRTVQAAANRSRELGS
jgi:pyrroline-5-carboxylate reductase